MTSLTTNAYSELRKAGFFSGTNLSDDVSVELVIGFCKTFDCYTDIITKAQALAAVEVIRDLLFEKAAQGKPVTSIST